MTFKNVVIYGANGGIGYNIAKIFLCNGYNLCLFSKNNDKLNKTLFKLKSNNQQNKILGYKCDVIDVKSIEESFIFFQALKKPIDNLVYCSGINYDNLIVKENNRNIEQVIGTNLIGAINVCKYYSKLMVKQNKGSILLIGSVIGSVGNVGQSTYASSKSALEGLVKSLYKELKHKNINVNLIAPGFVDTDFIKNLNKTKIIEKIPLGRLASTEEIANYAYFISTNKFINGEIAIIDGGLCLTN